MEPVLILLVMLAGGTHAFFSGPFAETKCYATSRCTVAVGGSVYIQVMTNASGLQVRCKKDQHSGCFFSLKRKEVTIEDKFKNRAQFFIDNGTLKITNVNKNDSGQYSSEIFYSNGTRYGITTVQLDVQETTPFILIIVSVIAGAVVVLVAVVLLVCCIRRKKSGSDKHRSDKKLNSLDNMTRTSNKHY